MNTKIDQAHEAEPMSGRPQHGPVTEPVATRVIGELGGPIAAMRRVQILPPTTLAVCIGYWYPCGCELRGSGPFYGWQFCDDHASLAREYSEIERLTEYSDGLRMTFKQAHEQLGWPDAQKQ